MPHKQFMVGDLPVHIYKRKANRSLRLSITAKGEVRVSIPAWAPYSAGVNFAKARQGWIVAQRKPASHLVDGQAVGKAHRLRFKESPSAVKATNRLVGSEIVVSHPVALAYSSPEVQKAAQAGGIKALRAQAEQLLPQRLASLAARHNFEYRDVTIKQLKSRWGSCDQHRSIVLNLFLMQLPWEYIDYVLLHELTHTQILRHGPDFWASFQEVLPTAKELRKKLHDYQPILTSPLTAV